MGIPLTEDGGGLAHKVGQLLALVNHVTVPKWKSCNLGQSGESFITSCHNLMAHAVCAGFVFSLRHCWTLLHQTMPTAEDHLAPLKEAIDNQLIPALLKRRPEQSRNGDGSPASPARWYVIR